MFLCTRTSPKGSACLCWKMAEPEKQLVRIWKIVDATEFDISVEVGFYLAIF